MAKPQTAAAAELADDLESDVFLEPDEEKADAANLPHISDREALAQHEIRVKSDFIAEPGGGAPMPGSGDRGAARRLSSTASGSSIRSRRSSHVPGENSADGLRRSNSTGTLFVDATVSAPNHEDTLRCVALALRYTVETGHTDDDPMLFAHIFDEKTFPLTEARVPESYATRIPDDDEIYRFVNKIFHAAALTAECAIVALVYINRVIQYTGLTVHASNWKRVVLGAILMASKVWDDQAVWNVDFCTILPKIEVEDMNDLERTYLEMLQFNINVDSSVYAKYYFELRGLAEEAERPFPLAPMSVEKAARLEATAKHYAETVRKASLRGAKSLEHKDFTARAVLP